MTARQFHDGRILRLEPGEVFVFGSNERGLHGAGAAALAKQRFGAEWGVGEGPTGRCYALPTKDMAIRTLPLAEIEHYAARFVAHATSQPGTRFLLTAVGCGLAGYTPAQIAPFFAAAPANVIFPPEFAPANR